jgi:hypothetical protein
VKGYLSKKGFLCRNKTSFVMCEGIAKRYKNTKQKGGYV